MRVVGVRGWRILVGESHGPRGGPRVRQWGQCVLVRGTAGAVVIVEGQVGHVCGGQERAGCWDCPVPLHLCQERGPSLGCIGCMRWQQQWEFPAIRGGGIGQRAHIPSKPSPPPSRDGSEGAPAEAAPGKTLLRGAPLLAPMPNADTQLPEKPLAASPPSSADWKGQN